MMLEHPEHQTMKASPSLGEVKMSQSTEVKIPVPQFIPEDQPINYNEFRD